MIGFGLLDWIKLGAGAALGAAVAAGPVYFKGRNDGKASAAVAALETTVKTLRKRGEIDAEIDIADRRALCAAMGLPDADRDECVRRLEEADAGTGDGG